MKVQTWLPDEEPTPHCRTFEQVRCPACTQLHFVSRATGRLLGDPE